MFVHVKSMTTSSVTCAYFQGLELVLSHKPTGAEHDATVVYEDEGVAMVTTVEEVSFPSQHAGSSVWKAHKWLLANLTSLPHFDTVRPMCCQALRQVRAFWNSAWIRVSQTTVKVKSRHPSAQ